MAMSKTVYIGTAINYAGREVTIHVQIQISNENVLSISGAVGDHQGQVQDTLRNLSIKFAKGWNRASLIFLLDIWKSWHLNNMQAWCTHKMDDDEVLKKLDAYIEVYEWKVRESVKDELLSGNFDDIRQYKHAAKMYAAALENEFEGSYEQGTQEFKALVDGGYLFNTAGDRPCTKKAGNVFQRNHPQGMIGAVCEVCGARYGTQWYRQELPVEVIAYLDGLKGVKNAR